MNILSPSIDSPWDAVVLAFIIIAAVYGVLVFASWFTAGVWLLLILLIAVFVYFGGRRLYRRLDGRRRSRRRRHRSDDSTGGDNS